MCFVIDIGGGINSFADTHVIHWVIDSKYDVLNLFQLCTHTLFEESIALKNISLFN